MQRSWQIIGILGLVALLSACGFHLRGSGASAELPFQSIYLNLPDSSAVGIELERYLKAGGTKVTATPAEAEVALDLIAESRDKDILTRNSQGRIREYTLLYRLELQVRDRNELVLLAPTTLSATRTLSFDESQALAKETEEASLYRDMQRDLVQQILRRLAALPVKPGMSVTPDPTSGAEAVAVPTSEGNVLDGIQPPSGPALP